MLRRLEELPSVWRYCVVALLGIGLWFVLRWIDDESDVPHVAIHLKLKPGGALHEPSQQLFSHHPADALARWRKLGVPANQVDHELAALAADPAVEEAFVEPTVSLPSLPSLPSGPAARDGDSCPITTPSYSEHQGYLDPAPGGIDAPAAWRLNARGAGVQFADIEGGWNANHEDLPGDRITHIAGAMINDPSWRAHGTAVLGEVVGRDNGKGVTGIAPDVDHIYTSSIGSQDVAEAIDAAAAQLHAGDVLLIELQGGGPRGRYVPMEYWDDNYDAIRAATDRGVVVIEAAGNGNEDLDLAVFKRKFDRTFRDSGAILVGAGGPPRAGYRDREKLDFSNYGSRVDVQGWGRKVATLDYGDLQKCTGEDRHYTDRHYTGEFSGTSSASPIVAGAAILVEGVAHMKGTTLAPRAVRTLLHDTGSPQQGSTKQQIGPRPDLSRAVAALGYAW
ncbi:MAG: S8 family peptidase [Kofleriaceae bacterium]